MFVVVAICMQLLQQVLGGVLEGDSDQSESVLASSTPN